MSVADLDRLRPATEADLAEAVASANGPLSIRGGGTRGATAEGTLLSVAGLTGVTLYEPGALTLVAQAGTPVAEIEAALASEGQMLPFEPMDHRALLGTEGTPTIGGAVALNASGPRRIAAGACRDSLIGVRFVDGRGTVVKNGGRVMKNVTGYDLVKLMAGARGTLGVLTEVAFKVLPKPETAAVLLLHDLDIATAVRAMAGALTSPYQVTGAAHAPAGLDGTPVTMIRLEGSEASVAERADKLAAALAQMGKVDIERRPGTEGAQGYEAGWRWVRDAKAFTGTDDDVWRISVRPSAAPDVAAQLSDARLLLDWGGGLIWAGVPRGTDVRQALSGLSAHATLVRADAKTIARYGTVPPEAPPLAKLAQGLRQQFDPRGILNPGVMG